MWVSEPEKIQLHDSICWRIKFSLNKRLFQRLVALLLVLLICWTILTGRFWDGGRFRSDDLHHFDNSSSRINKTSPVRFSQDIIAFWHEFATVLEASKPRIPLKDTETVAEARSFEQKEDFPDSRQSLLNLPMNDVKTLRESHETFLKKVKKLKYKIPYKRDSRGIVTTAAGEQLPELVVSLKILRESGSTLPVEVFVESDGSYEPEICEDVLPDLNATCYIISDILEYSENDLNLSRLQYRVFSVLFSSFENVLLLDNDNLVIQRPEDFMNAEPYTKTGLVTWPDYVRLSPYYTQSLADFQSG